MGYRPGRSTNDLTFAMRMLLEKSWEWNMDKFIAFVDLEQAFDRIDRDRLWEVMSKEIFNIPEK